MLGRQEDGCVTNARQNLLLLNIANAIAFTVISMLKPLVVLYCTRLGASPSIVGVVVSVYSLAPLFLAIPTGVLVKRYGARILIAVGCGGFLFGSVILAFAARIGAVILAQVIMGLFELLVIVSGQTMASNAGIGQQREANLGMYTMSASIGQLVGPSIGGGMVDLFGYQAAFLLSATLCLPAIFCALGLREARLERPKGERTTDLRRLVSMARSSGVKFGIVSGFGVIFAVGIQQVYFPVYLEDIGFSASVIGLLISARALASIVVRGFIPKIVAVVRGRFRTLMVAMALSALGVAVTTHLRTPLPLAVCSILLGAGVGLSMPLSLLSVADSVPPQEMGLAVAIRLTGNRLAQFCNPLIFGFVADQWGLRLAFYVCGVILLLTACWLTRWKSGMTETRETTLSANLPG